MRPVERWCTLWTLTWLTHLCVHWLAIWGKRSRAKNMAGKYGNKYDQWYAEEYELPKNAQKIVPRRNGWMDRHVLRANGECRIRKIYVIHKYHLNQYKQSVIVLYHALLFITPAPISDSPSDNHSVYARSMPTSWIDRKSLLKALI